MHALKLWLDFEEQENFHTSASRDDDILQRDFFQHCY